jgi:hypothetical protein
MLERGDVRAGAASRVREEERLVRDEPTRCWHWRWRWSPTCGEQRWRRGAADGRTDGRTYRLSVGILGFRTRWGLATVSAGARTVSAWVRTEFLKVIVHRVI